MSDKSTKAPSSLDGNQVLQHAFSDAEKGYDTTSDVGVLKSLVDTSDPDITYYGYSFVSDAGISDAVWQIKRVVEGGGLQYVEVASEGTYDNEWTNRTNIFTTVPVVNYNSVDFDGSNDFANTPLTPETTFDSTLPFSVSYWIKDINFNQGGILMDTLEASPGYKGVQIVYSTGTEKQPQITIIYNSATTNQIRARSAGLQIPNEWNHVVFTYDGSETEAGVLIYLNGVEQAKVFTQDLLTSTMVTTRPVNLGRRSLSADNYLRGQFDNFAIFNRVVTSGEVTSMYNDGGAPPSLFDIFSVSDINAWWTLGESVSTFPLEADKINGAILTYNNMVVGDIVNDTPGS